MTYERPEHFPVPPDKMQPGLRVLVPLGNSLRVGILSGRSTERLPESVVVKPMLWPLESNPALSPDYIEMAETLASRQMSPLGRILEAILPCGLRSTALTFSVDDPDIPKIISPKALRKMPVQELAALSAVWRDGRMKVRVCPCGDGEDSFFSLASDPPWRVRPNAKRQINVLEHLLENGPQTPGALNKILGQGASQVAVRLASAGLLLSGPGPNDGSDIDQVDIGENVLDGLTPTEEQEQALAVLMEKFDSEKGDTILVHGVTGSGKTYIYLRMVRRCLESGRSAVLLAPEVALAGRLWKSVSAAFPEETKYFYHGYQSRKKRESTFLDISAGDAPAIVVGTRSALFLPVRDMGLAVLDEEHDESFKQEERLSYQAKEVAYFRIQKSGGLLLLGSATPDVKTYHAAGLGVIPKVTLLERIGESRLPSMELVDMTGNNDPETPFAEKTVQELKAVIKAGEQAVIMLNRRGYAPLMYCLDCGEVVRCSECKVGMTYHKGREMLVCHYCGQSHNYPMLCSGCGGANFLPMGEGTEKLEEQLNKILPHDAGVLRLDRDSTRRHERMDQILDDFASGKAQVLVGTQMLSKGHHFPNVTLVIVANGDLGLNLPDYRSSERSFQLLLQVSGRAGRGDKPGKVLIQTKNPHHPFWGNVLDGDYVKFFNEEVEKRQRYGYPPFVKLGLIRISFPAGWPEGQSVLSILGGHMRKTASSLGVTVLGPAPAPLNRLKGRERFNCLVKAGDWKDVRTLFSSLRQTLPGNSKLRLSLDLDPVNML